MINSPLKDLKVVEIASVLAGPSVGMFFAESGARVVKIENKRLGGDVTRSWKLPAEDKNASVSAYFAAINYKKEYHLVDFTNSSEFSTVLERIKNADILIANFKRGDAEKFGLDYTTLKQLNPRLIYGEISGFGEASDRVAYDLILQAESGFMHINGTEDSGPVKMPVALIDILAGHQLKEGILVALLNRHTTGTGCKVHVSLYDSAIASLANQASNWLMTGINPQRTGSKHPNIAPYGDIFTTNDKRQVTLAIGSDSQFAKLCTILNLEQLVPDVRFSANQARVKNRDELAGILAQKISLFESAALLEHLNKAFVPGALIRTIEEVFADDQAKELIREEVIDGKKTRRVSSVVFKISV
ncbi:MAG: CoA transferase [Bacteroidetes bacterium]|nr:CoA transferase [Bacteroidota bacterium]